MTASISCGTRDEWAGRHSGSRWNLWWARLMLETTFGMKEREQLSILPSAVSERSVVAQVARHSSQQMLAGMWC